MEDVAEPHEHMMTQMRVDWTLPIWGVILVLIQGLAIIWGASSLNSTVQNDNKRITALEAQVASYGRMETTIARLDERTQFMVEEMKSMKRNKND